MSYGDTYQDQIDRLKKRIVVLEEDNERIRKRLNDLELLVGSVTESWKIKEFNKIAKSLHSFGPDC